MNGMNAGLPGWVDRNGNNKRAIHARGYTIVRARGQGKGCYVFYCSHCIRVPSHLLWNAALCKVHRNTAIECECDAAAGHKALAVYDQSAAGSYARTATKREAWLPDGEAEADKADDDQDWNGGGDNNQPGSAAAWPVSRAWMVRAV